MMAMVYTDGRGLAQVADPDSDVQHVYVEAENAYVDDFQLVAGLFGGDGFVDLFDGKVLTLQTPKGHHHPAALFTMIVHTRYLARFPADGHHFEPVVFVNQIARVKVRTPEQVFLNRISLDRMTVEEIVNGFAYEHLIRHFAKAMYKLIDRNSSHFATEHTEVS